MRHLTKKVTIMTDALQREAGKLRQIVVTIYPGGTFGLRLAKTRREECITLGACYEHAVKIRVRRERILKDKAKKERRKK